MNILHYYQRSLRFVSNRKIFSAVNVNVEKFELIVIWTGFCVNKQSMSRCHSGAVSMWNFLLHCSDDYIMAVIMSP